MIGNREFIGWALAAILSIGYFSYNWDPSPYENVEVVSVEQTDDGVLFVANFRKTDCEFRRLNVVGRSLGINEIIEWSDPTRVDDPNREEDREGGEHTLSLNLDVEVHIYEWIEVRTRHFCPNVDGESVEVNEDGVENRGEYVDRVFYRITPSDLQ